jgi:hypothetical protein
MKRCSGILQRARQNPVSFGFLQIRRSRGLTGKPTWRGAHTPTTSPPPAPSQPPPSLVSSAAFVVVADARVAAVAAVLCRQEEGPATRRSTVVLVTLVRRRRRLSAAGEGGPALHQHEKAQAEQPQASPPLLLRAWASPPPPVLLRHRSFSADEVAPLPGKDAHRWIPPLGAAPHRTFHHEKPPLPAQGRPPSQPSGDALPCSSACALLLRRGRAGEQGRASLLVVAGAMGAPLARVAALPHVASAPPGGSAMASPRSRWSAGCSRHQTEEDAGVSACRGIAMSSACRCCKEGAAWPCVSPVQGNNFHKGSRVFFSTDFAGTSCQH